MKLRRVCPQYQSPDPARWFLHLRRECDHRWREQYRLAHRGQQRPIRHSKQRNFCWKRRARIRGLAGNSGLAGTDGRTGTNALSSGISNCGGRTTAGGEGGTLICDGQNVSGGRGGTGQCPQSQEIDGNTPCSSSRAELCRNSCNAEMCDPLPPPQGVGTDGQGTGVAPAGAPTYDRWTNLGECNLCGLAAGLSWAARRWSGHRWGVRTRLYERQRYAR